MTQYKLMDEVVSTAHESTTGIEISDWIIKTIKGPILGSHEMDLLSQDLTVPVPEMVFGNSQVSLIHSKGFKIEFNARDALKQVDNSPENILQVHYSKDWLEQRLIGSKKPHQEQVKAVIKPYDWTFTTEYHGTISKSTNDQIDIERLKRKDPILYYNEAVLYEDELADNGMSTLSIRLRVMPTCFLVLQRFFLRVDRQLIRIKDHRLYHEFGTDNVLLETRCGECDYETLMIPNPQPWEPHNEVQDLRLVTDSNWVAGVMLDGVKNTRKMLKFML